jgi:hypothetical protein
MAVETEAGKTPAGFRALALKSISISPLHTSYNLSLLKFFSAKDDFDRTAVSKEKKKSFPVIRPLSIPVVKLTLDN